jgi:hypothetical protein
METVLVPAALGVPLTAPVDAFTVRPAGKFAPAHVYGGVPPVTARLAAYATPATPPGSDVVVMVSAGAMVRDRFFEALACVGLVESVTVIARVLVPATVGVPLIAPVDTFSVSPCGSPVTDQVSGALPPLAARVAL